MSGLSLGASGLWNGVAGLYSGVSGLALGTGLAIDSIAAGSTITIPGAVGEPGQFDVTISEAGVITTASTDLPDLGSGFQWGVEAGTSDARISVASTDPGQGSTMDVETSSGIALGDSAAFTITVTNGLLTLGFPFIANGTVAAPAYRADAQALFDRMDVQPDATRKALINQLFEDIEASGQLASLDALYIFAAHDQQAANLNWIADQYNITPSGSPTWVADRYYQGNGSSQYLNTGFNPTTAVSPNWALNTAMLGIWSATDLTSSTAYDAGALSGTNTLLLGRSTTGPGLRGAINGAAASFSTPNSLGHLMLYRTIAAGFNAYKDGSYVSYATGSSSSVLNSNMCFMRGNTNYSSRKLLVGYIGKQAGTHSAFDTALRTFLTAIGAI